MKYLYPKGATSVTIEVFIQDSASTTGAGKTGLAYNTASLTAYYSRTRAAPVAITLATQTVTGAYSSGGFVEMDATNMPGWYRFDLPDAMLASGVDRVGFMLKGAAGMAPCPGEIQLANLNVNDAVRAGLTALPNVVDGVALQSTLALVKAVTDLLPVPIWSGTLAGITDTTIEFPGGYGIHTQAQIVVELVSGTNAAGKSRYASYSGAGNIWNVDKSWVADSETRPSGTLVARAFSVPANPVTNLPVVNAARVGGTVQSAGDLSALLGTPAGASIAADMAAITAFVDELESRLTSTRAALLDKLNITGQVASSGEVTSIQNNTRVVRVVPAAIERPDAGSVQLRIELLAYDDVGNMEAPDSAPTLAVVNHAGTSRSANLDSANGALVSTGYYRWLYTVDVAHALEQLLFTFSVVEGGATRLYTNTTIVVDTTAVDFTAADRVKLDAIESRATEARLSELDTTAGKLAHDVAQILLTDRLTAGRAAAIDNLDAAVSSRATPSQVAGQVAAELATYDGPTAAELTAAVSTITTAMENALSSTARAELGAPPAANASLVAKITWLAMLARNAIEQTTTEQRLKNDAGTTIAVAPVADAGGVFTRYEFAAP